MAYLTESSYRQLIERIDIEHIERIDKQFFVENIFKNERLFYFFNQFELKRLLKEKIILSNNKEVIPVYKEVPKRVDDLNYILEIKGQVKYHKDNTCEALNRGFKNFFIPEPIVRLQKEDPEKHKILVTEIRNWFIINNFIVRYHNGEVDDNLLTTEFNQYFPKKFDIEPILISQSDKGQFKWHIERKTMGKIKVKEIFNYQEFLTKIADLITKREYLCNSTTMRNLSRYDFLINRTDTEIEKHISESIRNGYLKSVSEVFLENYGINNLKYFWKNHLILKKEAFNLLSEYLKWTYNLDENSFDEIFLENFNISSCNICYKP